MSHNDTTEKAETARVADGDAPSPAAAGTALQHRPTINWG
jgi:hypothetical protein